jgi:hypothetical protein
MNDRTYDFRTWSEGQTTYYGTENAYEFVSRVLLRGNYDGKEKTTEELEHQMGIDIERTGGVPIQINGLTPAPTIESFVHTLQTILGDGWERWKASLYRTFLVIMSQTIAAPGTIHFQQALLLESYALSGSDQSGHKIEVQLDPTTGKLRYRWIMNARIFPHDDPETKISINEFSILIELSPTAEGRYTGSLRYAMDQSGLFNTMVARCDTICMEAVRRVQKPAYSMLYKPVAVETPSREMKEYFWGIADRMLSALQMRERFPIPPDDAVVKTLRETLMPYFVETDKRIYDITPRIDDMYVTFFLLMKSAISYLNSPRPDFIRFAKLAQNKKSGSEGVYGIQRLLKEINVYMLVRMGMLPDIRIRPSPYVFMSSANERYRLERDAHRSGRNAPQPLAVPIEKTGETLSQPLATFASHTGLLGGRRSIVMKRDKRKKRTIKARKIQTRRS